MVEVLTNKTYCVRPDSLAIPWTESPFFEKLLASASLNSEEKALAQFFAENGYVKIDPEIPFEIIDMVVADLENKYVPGTPLYYAPGRIQDAWRFSDAVRKIAVWPKILDILELLYQRKSIPFQTLNFDRGTQQRTHSDTIHFQSVPRNFMCGVWVALEDIDAENGPLHYYPKSHRLPVYDMDSFGLPAEYSFYGKYENIIESMFTLGNFEKQEIRVKKGQAFIWAANLFHGGSKVINSERTRHSQVTHYFFSNCMYYTPIKSETFRNKTFFRYHLQDIRTNKIVPHYYKDAKVEHEPMKSNLRKLLPRTVINALKRLGIAE
jgi:hypothetical protein